MRIKGVVFDMDGTLLDSEVLYEKLSMQTVADMGFTPSRELVHSAIGMSQENWLRITGEHFGPTFDVQYFHDACQGAISEWYASKPIAIKKGAFELLDYLRAQGIPCAVASSTYSFRALPVLERLGLLSYMQCHVFGDMVKNGKPAPDIFVAAAEKLGLAPCDCMGIEDSYNGVRSSKGAGLFTVMIPDLLSPTEEIAPLLDACLPDLGEIIPLLEQLNA